MKFYRKTNGKWQLGNTAIPSGTCVEIVNEVTGKVTIQDVNGSIYAADILPTGFKDSAGDSYPSLEAYEAATAGFFVKAPTYGGKQLLPYYVDIDFPIIIRNTGTGIPTMSPFMGNITAPQWAVNDYNVCEGQEFIHAWKEGSEAFWHIHLITGGSDTTNRFVKFEIEYCHANHMGVVSQPQAVSAEITIPGNTPDRTMIIAPIGSFVFSDGKITSHLWARLKRVASTGTAPTANPFCTMLQAHVLCDSIGSETLSAK